MEIDDNIFYKLNSELEVAKERVNHWTNRVTIVEKNIKDWSDIDLLKEVFQISKSDTINKIINYFTIGYTTKEGKKMIAMQFLGSNDIKHFDPKILN